MKFEMGKVYRHTNGRVFKIVGSAQSTTYGGLVLIAEQVHPGETFVGAGTDDIAALNWELVGDEIWESQFSR